MVGVVLLEKIPLSVVVNSVFGGELERSVGDDGGSKRTFPDKLKDSGRVLYCFMLSLWRSSNAALFWSSRVGSDGFTMFRFE